MSDIELISPESVNADPSPVKSKTKIDEEEQWNNYIDVYMSHRLFGIQIFDKLYCDWLTDNWSKGTEFLWLRHL